MIFIHVIQGQFLLIVGVLKKVPLMLPSQWHLHESCCWYNRDCWAFQVVFL